MTTIQTADIGLAADTKRELLKCRLSVHYFINEYCQIYDATALDWIPFRLWPAQSQVLSDFEANRQVVVLKARQEGLTWLALAYCLHRMLFHPVTAVALFSKRDTESMYLLGDERMQGMYNRLPEWMRFRAPPQADSAHNWILPNGSSAKAFPTSAGDSYTFTIALVDEADLCPDLGGLMRSVKPTIDGGGQMLLISRSDKKRPQSPFKAIYRAAVRGENGWHPIFLPWHIRPDRDEAWYEAQRVDILSRNGSLDDLHEQYPATDAEALSPRTLDKRIPPTWLEACYRPEKPRIVTGNSEPAPGAPAVPGLRIWRPPEKGRQYRIGLDPAEGNPTSDDSALVVLDAETGEEAAHYRGKAQPTALASYADQVGTYYNRAALLVERNNHGHAVLLWLEEHSDLEILRGEDKKPGWLSSSLGKTRLYDELTEAVREGEIIIHSLDAFTQLSAIEGSSLRAPEGQMDDLADAFAFAAVARRLKPKWRKQEFLGF